MFLITKNILITYTVFYVKILEFESWLRTEKKAEHDVEDGGIIHNESPFTCYKQKYTPSLSCLQVLALYSDHLARVTTWFFRGSVFFKS